MGKILNEHTLRIVTKDFKVVYNWSDVEGYGVYLDDGESVSSTVSFGQGKLSKELSLEFFRATIHCFEELNECLYHLENKGNDITLTFIKERSPWNDAWLNYDPDTNEVDYSRLDEVLRFIHRYAKMLQTFALWNDDDGIFAYMQTNLSRDEIHDRFEKKLESIREKEQILDIGYIEDPIASLNEFANELRKEGVVLYFIQAEDSLEWQ